MKFTFLNYHILIKSTGKQWNVATNFGLILIGILLDKRYGKRGGEKYTFTTIIFVEILQTSSWVRHTSADLHFYQIFHIFYYRSKLENTN